MKKPFYEVLYEFIFEVLGMKNAYMNGSSAPAVKSEYPVANLYIKDVNLLSIKNLCYIDYAGGGVVAPLEEYLKFMKALVKGDIIKKETLENMINDDVSMGAAKPGIHYGYAVWKFVPVPVLLPEKLTCWGCVGVTGAFMFYHQKTDSYIIGSFNDMSTIYWALGFMLNKIIKPLTK